MKARRKGAAAARRKTRDGTHVIYPPGLATRWGVSRPTLWRWEKVGRIPRRDFFIGGEAVGWRPETIEAHERGQPLAVKEAAFPASQRAFIDVK